MTWAVELRRYGWDYVRQDKNEVIPRSLVRDLYVTRKISLAKTGQWNFMKRPYRSEYTIFLVTLVSTFYFSFVLFFFLDCYICRFFTFLSLSRPSVKNRSCFDFQSIQIFSLSLPFPPIPFFFLSFRQLFLTFL